MRVTPNASHKNIIVQELSRETLICNLETHRVFCLNITAGEVWKLCNGKNDIALIAQLLSAKLNSHVSEEMVLLALDELAKENLLLQYAPEKKIVDDLTRRQVIQRIGLASTVAMPIVSAITMPLVIDAASVGFGGSCTLDSDCRPGLSCSGGLCKRSQGQACSTDTECASGFCTDGVCCEARCSGTCEKCNLAGRVGFCDAIPAGTDPDNECPTGPGLSGVCNGARACM